MEQRPHTVVGHCPLCASRRESYGESILQVTYVCTGCKVNVHRLRFDRSVT